jgi:hypothetical protein
VVVLLLVVLPGPGGTAAAVPLLLEMVPGEDLEPFVTTAYL